MNSKIKDKLHTSSAYICIILFIFICTPLFFNNYPYLDDYYLILMQKQEGFWAPTKSFQSMWGSYRIVFTTLMAFLYSIGENLWAARTFGLILHAGNSWLIYSITKQLRWNASARFICFALFLFFPYSLEAIAWPSNVTQYPLAPFLMLSGVTTILSKYENTRKFIIGAILLGSSVWIHEQVGPFVVLFLIILAFGFSKRETILFGSITLGVMATNFALIFATRSTNIRLSGENAGTLLNAWHNIGITPNLVSTTPLGRYFYATEGLPGSIFFWVLPITVGGFVSLTVPLSTRRDDAHIKCEQWIQPLSRWFWPGIFCFGGRVTHNQSYPDNNEPHSVAYRTGCLHPLYRFLASYWNFGKYLF